MTIDIKPRSAAVFLGVIIVFLALAHLLTVVSTYYWGHNYVLGLVPLFNMDEEQNLPTYFSSAQILLCSCLAFAIAVAEKKPPPSRLPLLDRIVPHLSLSLRR